MNRKDAEKLKKKISAGSDGDLVAEGHFISEKTLISWIASMTEEESAVEREPVETDAIEEKLTDIFWRYDSGRMTRREAKDAIITEIEALKAGNG
jgi:hypothetical protein